MDPYTWKMTIEKEKGVKNNRAKVDKPIRLGTDLRLLNGEAIGKPHIH